MYVTCTSYIVDDITIKTVCTKMTDKDIKQEVYLNFVSQLLL